ncbi:DNA repair protein complementing XP-A cells homolog [Patella vulgata]|uniref:DNA repair protein complementing XP-A cells homolog n=1 Tax=Patella vulgata TaxID=6465 RepID=UPI00218034B6|nr:DNA repair protein complementing XP-A cells homolog [Patella vulgata]
MSDKIDTGVVEEEPVKLTPAQRAKIERNRQKALLLKQARLASKPYDKLITGKDSHKVKPLPKEIDTGAGFFIEEENTEIKTGQLEVKHQPAPVLAVDNLLCESCDKEFMDSYLYTHFTIAACDSCREKNKDTYNLTTKTDAKNRYLLKDEDFDKREPPLKFIVKKNPNNNRWGDMKLFLESQVYYRAIEVWGSEEAIEEERETRSEKKDKAKQKKFDKRVKELRNAVRSSLWRKGTTVHEHEYGEESYDEEEDMYSKKCKTCEHLMTYEKM